MGPTYGRKMMKGYLAACGVHVSGHQLRSTLPAVSPQYHAMRTHDVVERTNPKVYIARYFGHRLHIDQNEKIAMYGLVYVLARDGFSGKIVAGAVMNRKNNMVIYEKVYRSAVLEFGLWQQIRVDQGREFYLMLFIQENLRSAHGDPSIAPYRQTTSRENHVIERIWVELNHRVTYPLKRVITDMDNDEEIDLGSNLVKFCVSAVTQEVAKVGMKRMIMAWNAHSLPHRGIPNVLQHERPGTIATINVQLPSTRDAVDMYRQQGGILTDPSEFGTDPLENDTQKIDQREQEFHNNAMSFEDIFSNVISDNDVPFREAILLYIDITVHLST